MIRTRFFAATAFAAGCLALTFGAMAGDDERQVMMYKLASDSGVERTVRLDSAETGLNLHDLADGESRGVTTGDGQYVLLTRNGNTLTFGIDGEEYEVPFGMGGLHGAHGMLAEHGDGDHVVKIVHGGDSDSNDLVILSGTPLDEASRETIRNALESAGIDRTVRFADGGVEMDIEIDGLDSDGQDAKVVHKRVIRKVHSED